jgi:thymidylate synthase (FAD)
MKVKLISYSKTVEDDKSMTDLVAYCARVSNPNNQEMTETNDRLIQYLIRNQHWSPFEMVSICIEIETTRDIIRQILRHRSFSFQEFSQRYAIADLGFECRESRLQDNKNRQNSLEHDDDKLKEEWTERQETMIQQVKDNYNWAISNGIAKEQARAVLPEGMTLSKIYMNGTLRSWIHYIELRSSNGTQKEHREVAIACGEIIEKLFPMERDK